MREMVASGLVTIQNHTFDMHQYAPCETGRVRANALRLSGESQADYFSAFCQDYRQNVELIRTNLGYTPTVFAYPNGKYDALSEQILHRLGAQVTLSTDVGLNTLKYGDKDCLFRMKRYNINEKTDLKT